MKKINKIEYQAQVDSINIWKSLNRFPMRKIIDYWKYLKCTQVNGKIFLEALNIVIYGLNITDTEINEGDVIKFPNQILKPNRKIGRILYD